MALAVLRSFIWVCVASCVSSAQLDYGAFLQQRPAMDAEHLYLVPPECKWDGKGKEPPCDSVPATQRTLARYVRSVRHTFLSLETVVIVETLP